jgi:hypothetical protein
VAGLDFIVELDEGVGLVEFGVGAGFGFGSGDEEESTGMERF